MSVRERDNENELRAEATRVGRGAWAYVSKGGPGAADVPQRETLSAASNCGELAATSGGTRPRRQ
ncbi:hypothetical protein ACJ72_01306 [Emergomyces africanus]|uniref:Uncharacterized protein n=1 Tax=Emergomyces africanus TaxID=1955775 RepID=A0A1B7P5M1_9EURO|nr:hypothetical protein ACJ72_01306 [Emergomyces africanus]